MEILKSSLFVLWASTLLAQATPAWGSDSDGDGVPDAGNIVVSSDQGIYGYWKLAGENSFRVGPAPLNGDWFSASSGIVNSRYCLMDDLYAFAESGGFKNVQGELTWLEGWQNEGTEACGAPVAPHDGADGASFAYDAQDGEIVVTGTGAYLGLPSKVNAGEIPGVSVPDSITYTVQNLASDGSSMTVYLESGSGVFWSYDFVKQVGVIDQVDSFPLDPNASKDSDGDGKPDSWNSGYDGTSSSLVLDDDDDNDGVLDELDAFPFDASETLDTDNDGIGDNADLDDDGDGAADSNDSFPLDASETVDTDGDGIGNNADTDDDGDGTADLNDAFPLNSNEWIDSDSDGVGNNADVDDDGDFVPDQAGWLQIGSDIDGEAAGDRSGWSVSLSEDGTKLAVGSYPSLSGSQDRLAGVTNLYSWSGTAWARVGDPVFGESQYDNSGFSVSLSKKGDVVAIGAWANDGNGDNSGHVRIYHLDRGLWVQRGSDIDGVGAGDGSGVVALSSDGSRVVVGSPTSGEEDQGHVRVFEWANDAWLQLGADIKGEAAYDYSGSRVSISDDGSTIAIAAWGNDGGGADAGHIRVYSLVGGQWIQLGADIDGEDVGTGTTELSTAHAISISGDGSTIAFGMGRNDAADVDAGRVRVYEMVGGSWSQRGPAIDGQSSGEFSGSSVSLSRDGTVLAIGALRKNGESGLDSGGVRVFEWTAANAWDLVGEFDGEAAFDLSSVVSLSADGSTLAVGAVGNDQNGAMAGHVRVHRRFKEARDIYPLVSLGLLADTDSDGEPNDCDADCLARGMMSDGDDDGDGVADGDDAFPLDASETLDTDSDGTGNNADSDDDGDGVADGDDAFPLDASETLDTDSDGTGNNADSDDDGDGLLDEEDAFPTISLDGKTDSDSDGYPDQCDASCEALGDDCGCG